MVRRETEGTAAAVDEVTHRVGTWALVPLQLDRTAQGCGCRVLGRWAHHLHGHGLVRLQLHRLSVIRGVEDHEVGLRAHVGTHRVPVEHTIHRIARRRLHETRWRRVQRERLTQGLELHGLVRIGVVGLHGEIEEGASLHAGIALCHDAWGLVVTGHHGDLHIAHHRSHFQPNAVAQAPFAHDECDVVLTRQRWRDP